MSNPAVDERPLAIEDLTPRQTVAELDKYVIGQDEAKRAVAIALRNRWRRQLVDPELAEEILPKNILMIGPTGVGKTEIARRLARLARAPFMKVEASKFTEVGYVGRDVESIIRDLVEIAVQMVKDEMRAEVAEEAEMRAEDRLLSILVPTPPAATNPPPGAGPPDLSETREKYRKRLRDGKLDDKMVEIEVEEDTGSAFQIFGPGGGEDIGEGLKDMLPNLFARRRKTTVPVSQAREILLAQESDAIIDRNQVQREARRRVEQAGMVFLDEIDKIAAREDGRGPDVSREGVQRDLLPIVEGSTVSTKYGPVKTDHILFIAAGAFHVARPSDLIPELQGRFPIRVELSALGEDEFVRILTEPENALTRQYQALLETEGLTIEFTDDAVRELAQLAVAVNDSTENIGARRLATLMEKLLEEISFEAPDMDGVDLTLDAAAVQKALGEIARDQDLSRYVL